MSTVKTNAILDASGGNVMTAEAEQAFVATLP